MGEIISDQQEFLRQIPDLIVALRMRRLALALTLNLSESSLGILDREIAEIVGALPDVNHKIEDVIGHDVLRQLTAYVGEVIVRNRNGQWQISAGENLGWPQVVYPVSQPVAGQPVRWKAIDVYEQIIFTMLEGDTLANWYAAEVLESQHLRNEGRNG